VAAVIAISWVWSDPHSSPPSGAIAGVTRVQVRRAEACPGTRQLTDLIESIQEAHQPHGSSISGNSGGSVTQERCLSMSGVHAHN
jgi:hypothetical protein